MKEPLKKLNMSEARSKLTQLHNLLQPERSWRLPKGANRMSVTKIMQPVLVLELVDYSHQRKIYFY